MWPSPSLYRGTSPQVPQNAPAKDCVSPYCIASIARAPAVPVELASNCWSSQGKRTGSRAGSPNRRRQGRHCRPRAWGADASPEAVTLSTVRAGDRLRVRGSSRRRSPSPDLGGRGITKESASPAPPISPVSPICPRIAAYPAIAAAAWCSSLGASDYALSRTSSPRSGISPHLAPGSLKYLPKTSVAAQDPH